jgi:type IV pilus assembly protein PilW
MPIRFLASSRGRSQRGFGLTEVMVGLVVGMFAILAVLQVYAVSEGQKRTTTSGSDAQTNATVALYTMEREIRMAGYGMANQAFLSCPNITRWNDDLATTQALTMVPIQINPPTAVAPAGDANTDVVAISYGTSDSLIEGISVDQLGAPGSSANFKVDNRAGFSQGDLVVGVQTLPTGVVQCTMHQISGIPGGQCGDPEGAGGGSTNLIHNTGMFGNASKNCQKQKSKYNKAGAIAGVAALTKDNNAMLFNLGGTPQVMVFAIRNGNLTTCDGFLNDCTNAANFVPIVNDAVSLRLVYGKDADGDGVVDTWNRTAPATGAQWRQVLAVTIAIVTRSSLLEKPTESGTCNITTNSSRPDNQEWRGQSIAGAGIDLSSTGSSWGCYRYRLLQTVIPIRNMIWRPV